MEGQREGATEGANHKQWPCCRLLDEPCSPEDLISHHCHRAGKGVRPEVATQV